jgi:3-oxoacyl-[acyl-carrier-protein] synthase-1
MLSRRATRPYPVTSWSVVNALGTTTDQVVRGLRSGRPMLSPPPPGTGFATACGAVSQDLAPLQGELAGLDSRNNRFVACALEEMAGALEAAVERWGPARVGICVGSSTAAMDEIEGAYAAHARTGAIPEGFDVLANGSADGLVRVLKALSGFEGPAAIVSNACASSGKAFASAKRWLEAGVVDAVLVGGADSLCQITLRGFRALGLLSEGPSRPFSSERRGIHIGEGAAFALLERAGEGPLLLGAGESADAHHMTTPDPEGLGASAAMRAALADAGVAPANVDYVNAHGTGTRFNDAMEARAIRAALGRGADPIVVSTKGYVGHTLGAAGAMEAVFVLEALQAGWVPASAGADPVDPDLGLHVATAVCETDLRVGLSNSFAFGGSNVSLVFGVAQ